MQTTSAHPRKRKQTPRDEYGDLLDSLRVHFASVVGNGRPLFTTDSEGLWPVFLGALPSREVQHHTCHACRHFVERFGGLVAIEPDGRTVPVMWGEAPGFYKNAFAAARKKVSRSKVTGVFLSSDPVWGLPVTGDWKHMAVAPPASMLFRRSLLKTAGQAMAERREEYGMLQRGLAEFVPHVVGQALSLLESEALYRNEKCLGPAKWLAELHEKRSAATGKIARENLTWLAVATAPPGFAHVRSTMIGTLLEDLAAGMEVGAIRSRFAAKMHPLQYQRPQSEPSEGNIAQAEKVIAALQSAGSLERRFARLSDVKPLWLPTPRPERQSDGGGVFGHLRGRSIAPAGIEIPAVTMTWEKFARTVLPEAESIEAYVPSHGAFIAMVTAANPDAPPILQWDDENNRNPVSWYVYSGGSYAIRWGLRGDSWAKVNAIAGLPFMWDESRDFSHQGAGVVLILDGCRDSENSSLSLFPETLRGEYREIRKTIEAYSRSRKLLGQEEASACGLDLRKGQRWSTRVRVTSKGGSKTAVYSLDRWD